MKFRQASTYGSEDGSLSRVYDRTMFTLKARGLAYFGEVTWEIPEGFLAVTGETGAGKSLLAGSLRFALGGDLPTGDPLDATLVVEEISEGVRQILRAHELPDEAPLILRRVWDPERRRGRVFIQDTPATLRLLRKIADSLALFHEQQENLVGDPEKLLSLVDAYAGLEAERRKIREVYEALSRAQRELQTLRERFAEKRLREEVLAHERALFAELPDPEAWKEISRELDRMEHLQELAVLLGETASEMQSGTDALTEALRRLEEAANLDPGLVPARDELARVVDLLEEQKRDLERYADGLEMDEEERVRLQTIGERVRSLMLRYHTDFEGLLAVRERLEKEWEELSGLEARLQEAETRVEKLSGTYDRLAGGLTQAREAVLPEISRKIQAHLKKLRLPRARVVLIREEAPPGPFGKDRIHLLFHAHGDALMDASRASGGERARLSLALLAVFSGELAVPLVVLDEIDAAVGGDTAHAVGEMLRDLGAHHSVVAITHWPQVAARARTHHRVVKEEGKPVRMRLQVLSGEDRVVEIARMLGDPEDPAVLQVARELLGKGEVRAG